MSQLAQDIIERQLAVLDSEDWGSGLLCAGVWPDRIPSALLCTEDSCFSSVQRDGQVLLYCLNTLSLYGKRSEYIQIILYFVTSHFIGVNEIVLIFVFINVTTIYYIKVINFTLISIFNVDFFIYIFLVFHNFHFHLQFSCIFLCIFLIYLFFIFLELPISLNSFLSHNKIN